MKYIFSILFISFYFNINAQCTLRGNISAEDSSSPLEQVSVYLPQIEKGSVTGDNGAYTMENLPVGTYKIIASFMGYQTFSSEITLTEGINTLDIVLLPSAIEMEEVIVSTPFHKLQRENVMKVEQAKVVALRKMGAITLADGITNIPGVESVSTGIGIGKPVIRGLSSNRVLVYSQSIRLENQQFGDEHGLGIGASGVESVEVIKGPASLLYGSDALGGVLYLNPEQFANMNSTEGSVNLNYFTNTQGMDANAGFKTSGERFKFLVRGSYASHADYKGGNDIRVTNSRFNEFDIKTALGYQFGIFKTELRYNLNSSDLGIPEEIGIQDLGRTPITPYQEINNHIVSSKSDLFFNNSSLRLTLGYIFNSRKEFEEEEDTEIPTEDQANLEPALDMQLSTFSYNLQYNLPSIGRWQTIAGIQGMNQKNENFGEEVLIPDALTNDIGILVTSHIHFEKSDIQLGLRFDNRSIKGEETGILGEEGYIAELDRNFNSFNAAMGYRIDLLKNLIGRINIASGFRAPNLAELTSNGIHEGTNRFEIGNPNLKNENNVQTDIALEYSSQHFEFFANGFYNIINDYIFIEPNGEFVDNNPVYNYIQQDATLYGGEIGFHFHPHPLDWLHVQSSFESVTGQLDNDDYLPLIPANKLSNTIRLEFNNSQKWITNSYTFITLNSIFDQNKVATFETPTNGYNLLNAGFGASVKLFKQDVELVVTALNILNQDYISHLSRLKVDDISNIGRNINIGLSIPL
ncbi:TonB-dependent receptor [uncultured Eudoraea sp.]|uniref:TonB-dependent receptor n=1 Tax=uncultured Eudoraea sp. TaxID=1035614 RepID=UPI0026083A29|nr:TonB-dependent receptor [uncultured Eudoraea sp.]